MKVYQFIKYNDTTSLDNYIVNADDNTVFCFDFEDSIQDCLDPSKTSQLKLLSRNYFRKIINKYTPGENKINIGIRINAAVSNEYLLDIQALEGTKNISTIFLPKTSSADQIWDLQERLKGKNIGYKEIIPVIETKNGLNHLANILENTSGIINAIAFGHCDYNLDSGIYPFFHQDSREYWSWVKRIFETIKPYKIAFVNSPFLQLQNSLFFKEMLDVLYAQCGDQIGQITLTRLQTNICNSFSAEQKKKINSHKIRSTLDLRVPESYAIDYMQSFEKNKNHKSFGISKEGEFLSPQEYTASKYYLAKKNWPEINFTFVGGCFPVKGNILFENRFHQIIKDEVEKKAGLRFNVNIIRYERYKDCLQRISAFREKKPIDILAFSIRPEPFLRLVKLYFKFHDDSSDKVRWSLNIPLLNKIEPEKYDLLSLESKFQLIVPVHNSIIRKTLINLNYILGLLFGNGHYGLKEYLKVINDIKEFSKNNNIQFILMGPSLRTNTLMEKSLSKWLDRTIKKIPGIFSGHFVSGSDLKKDGENLFEANGIYVNEKYHELIAERMGKQIMMMIEKMENLNLSGNMKDRSAKEVIELIQI